jgi:hypothetical protein
MAVTWVLAEVATNYVVNASMRRQQEQLSQQLQESLDSRVVIEQASEITGRRYWTIGSISTTHALVEAAAASAVSVTDGPR